MSYLRRHDWYLVVYQYLFIQSMLSAVDGYPKSPCPEILQYNYNSNQNLIGIIEVPPQEEYGNYVDLDVEVSAENSIQGYNINVDMLNPFNQVIDELRQGKPLRYQLTFTYSMNTPPVVTNISLNGKQICHGKPLLDALSSSPVSSRHGLIIPGQPIKVKIKPNQPSVHTTTALYDSNSIHSSKPTNTFIYNVNVDQKVSLQVESNYQYNTPSNYNPQNHNNLFTASKPSNIHFYPKQTTSTTQTPLSHKSGTDTESQSTELHYAHRNDRFTTNSNNDYYNYYSTSWTSKKPVSTTTIGTTTTTRAPTTRPVTTTADPNLFQRLKPFTGGDCGITTNPSMSITDEISASSKGLHPWLAALFLQNSEGLKFACGSTLVSTKHVITAAHCVETRGILYKSEDLLVALGRTNIKRWATDGSQLVEADSVHVHPEYKPNVVDADVAMITLKKEAIFSNSIRPACMWIGKTDVNLIASSKGTVAGWGTDEFDNILTAEAGQITLPVVSQDVCVRSNAAFEQLTSSRTFCGGNRNNSGPCTGDSGSGFLMKINERWTLRGIVSVSLARKSDGTCDLEQYVVFADVAKFLSWILPFLETSL